jgi:hypothetical protein
MYVDGHDNGRGGGVYQVLSRGVRWTSHAVVHLPYGGATGF